MEMPSPVIQAEIHISVLKGKKQLGSLIHCKEKTLVTVLMVRITNTHYNKEHLKG